MIKWWVKGIGDFINLKTIKIDKLKENKASIEKDRNKIKFD